MFEQRLGSTEYLEAGTTLPLKAPHRHPLLEEKFENFPGMSLKQK